MYHELRKRGTSQPGTQSRQAARACRHQGRMRDSVKPIQWPGERSRKVCMAVALMPGLERRLNAEVAGEVLFDRFTRGRYATDASHYQMIPVGVVIPRDVAAAERAVAI